MLELQTCITMPLFLQGPGDLNYGPHAYLACTLSQEYFFPAWMTFFFFIYKNCILMSESLLKARSGFQYEHFVGVLDMHPIIDNCEVRLR